METPYVQYEKHIRRVISREMASWESPKDGAIQGLTLGERQKKSSGQPKTTFWGMVGESR